MEVLPPPAPFVALLPPTVFSERMNAASQFSSTSQNPSTPPSNSASSPQGTDLSLHFTVTPSPTKLVTGGFLPLPTIVASPICTPSPSFGSPAEGQQSHSQADPVQTRNFDLTPTESNDRLKDKTPPNSHMSLRVLFATPTWISTPPTPPQKHIRNLLPYDPQRPSTPVSPSASFPASTSPHATPDGPAIRLKRCLSVPTMSPRSRAISDPTLAFESLSKSCLSEPFKNGQNTRIKCSKPIFHLPKDVDDCSSIEYAPSVVGLSPAESCEGHESTTNKQTREMKDAMRIFHGLQELLFTEIDYVKDLRILIIAYIQRLATFEVRASAFARASASFSTGPWINAYAGQTLNPTDGMVPSPSSTSTRPIFTEGEIEIIARNLKDILRIHEDFISALRGIVASFELSNILCDSGSLRPEHEVFSTLASALEAISKKIITEAPKFEVYQTLCAGHPEAMGLIQRVISQYPSEWEVFEQRCWSTASKLDALGDGHYVFNLSRNQSPGLLDVPLSGKSDQKRRRTMSAVTLGSTPSTKESDRLVDTKQPRLVFTDYLIKPVQRICKYPLLLQQLTPKSALFESGEATLVIEDAIQVMRGVASSVDEARRKREAITKSSLIISRFVLPPPSPSLNSGSPISPTAPGHTLAPTFLSSLGPCLLAGSLDVMYYTPRQSLGQIQAITAKYLGVFLYSGGYLILAKIHKGKKYEPRHWFPLTDFEATRVEDDEAMLPYSFRLSSETIIFDLAAACQKERDIWMEAMSNSRKQESTRRNAPLPSFKLVGKGGRSSDLRSEGLTANTPAYPVPGASDTEVSAPSFRADSRRRKLTLRKSDIAALQDQSRHPNRRSSTASIKSIFAPMGHDPDSIYINRSLVSGRLQIDHELQDVASQVCLSARLQVLFPQPSQQYNERSGFSRSNSAISVAGLARNRLSKQESLRIPRRKYRCDSMTAFEAQLPPDVPPLPLSARRSGKRLSLQALPPRSLIMTAVDSAHPLSTSPTPTGTSLFDLPLSAPASSSMSSNPLSRPSSPLSLNRPESKHKFVRSMKGFFARSGSTSPESPSNLRSGDAKVEHQPPLLRRLTMKKTSRRRSRSVAPDEELPVPG
ncbi:hypothetical protein AN958_05447 [Leucoagaricus sp. SymC.cos]|nr:hypothetical protein AN958_05447 [Leucoagaricus sp. SymC.cos]